MNGFTSIYWYAQTSLFIFNLPHGGKMIIFDRPVQNILRYYVDELGDLMICLFYSLEFNKVSFIGQKADFKKRQIST